MDKDKERNLIFINNNKNTNRIIDGKARERRKMFKQIHYDIKS